MNKLPLAENADEIFEIDDRPERIIEVPEWGKSVVVRELDAKTMAIITKSTTDEKGNIDSVEFSSRVILEGMVKPKLSPAHIEKLKARSNRAFLRVYNEIAEKKKEPLNN